MSAVTFSKPPAGHTNIAGTQNAAGYVGDEAGVVEEVIERVKLSNRDVLFVDDDERWMRILERWFEGTPYACHFAKCGLEALKILEDKDIDLVVSDMSMPVMTGSQLMREIQVKYPHVIRVIMSGKFDVMNTIDAINKGHIYRYIVKPCEHKELKLVVYESLQLLERDEKKQRRDREIKRNITYRIRTMAKSIKKLNQTISSTNQGVMQILQNLVLHSPEDQAKVERAVTLVRTLCEQLDISPDHTRELELAAMFQKVAYDHAEGLSMDHSGQVNFEEIEIKHPELIQKSSRILADLGYPLASEIVKVTATWKPGNSLSLEHDGIEVGAALCRFAHEYATLIEDFHIDDFRAIELLRAHAERYGGELFFRSLNKRQLSLVE